MDSVMRTYPSTVEFIGFEKKMERKKKEKGPLPFSNPFGPSAPLFLLALFAFCWESLALHYKVSQFGTNTAE